MYAVPCLSSPHISSSLPSSLKLSLSLSSHTAAHLALPQTSHPVRLVARPPTPEIAETPKTLETRHATQSQSLSFFLSLALCCCCCHTLPVLVVRQGGKRPNINSTAIPSDRQIGSSCADRGGGKPEGERARRWADCTKASERVVTQTRWGRIRKSFHHLGRTGGNQFLLPYPLSPHSTTSCAHLPSRVMHASGQSGEALASRQSPAPPPVSTRSNRRATMAVQQSRERPRGKLSAVRSR